MKLRSPDSHSNYMPSEELLPNPHKGFTSFQRFSSDGKNLNWSPERGWQMEHLTEEPWVPTPSTDGYYPKTRIAYFRLPWSRLEPRDGEYDLAIIDRLLERAEATGEKLMLRLIPHAARPELDLPPWFKRLHNLADREIGDKCSPITEAYFRRFGEVVARVCKMIDGNHNITSMDMSIVSAWGEGSQMDMLPSDMWKPLVRTYMESLKNTPLSAQFNSPELVHYASTYRPIGFRADCLGNMNAHMFNHYPHLFPEMKDSWLGGPIQFETCWVVGHWLNMGWDIDYIIEQSLKWHITSLNAKSVAIPEVWRGKMEEWEKKMGYRFSVRRLDYPHAASSGDTLSLCLWIENRGVAPIYHKYDFVLRLKGDGASLDYPQNVDIRKWLPGDNILNLEIHLPEDLKKGSYRLEAGIVGDNENILFATSSERSDGFSVISGEIKIG